MSSCLSPIYTIQLVVKPVWQPIKCLYTWYNRLSNQLSDRFDNRLYCVYKHPTGCTTQFDNRLNEQWLFVQHVKPAWQPVGCLFTWYSRLSNLSDNWLYSEILVSVSTHNRSFRGRSFKAINCTATDNITIFPDNFMQICSKVYAQSC